MNQPLNDLKRKQIKQLVAKKSLHQFCLPSDVHPHYYCYFDDMYELGLKHGKEQQRLQHRLNRFRHVKPIISTLFYLSVIILTLSSILAVLRLMPTDTPPPNSQQVSKNVQSSLLGVYK